MIIVAIDPPFNSHRDERDFLEKLIRDTRFHVEGYKIGLPLILEYGLKIVDYIKDSSGRRVIIDLKLADIGDIMVKTLRKISTCNPDAVIAHGFIGVEKALDDLVREAGFLGIDVILVISMSHPGSGEYIDYFFEKMLRDALRLGVHGVVVGAGKTSHIRRVRELGKGSLKIYSPGIGVQGIPPGTAICSGADYEIIGRLITGHPDPGSRIREIYSELKERLKTCLGSQ